MRHFSKTLPVLLFALLMLSIASCGRTDPGERVAAIRGQYSVSLEGFAVDRPGPAVDRASEPDPSDGVSVSAEASATAEATATAAEASGEEGDAEDELDEPGPRPAEVMLQLLVRFSGEDPLPGVTVEVTQADREGEQQPPTLHWIETAGIGQGELRQVDLALEGVPYEEGDAFSVTLRPNIPAEDRGQYREFAQTDP